MIKIKKDLESILFYLLIVFFVVIFVLQGYFSLVFNSLIQNNTEDVLALHQEVQKIVTSLQEQISQIEE